MKNFKLNSVLLPMALAVMLFMGGCNKKSDSAANPALQAQPAADQSSQGAATAPAGSPAQSAPASAESSASTPAPASVPQAAATPEPPPAPLVIPAGTRIRVSLAQPLGSKISQPGQSFKAT